MINYFHQEVLGRGTVLVLTCRRVVRPLHWFWMIGWHPGPARQEIRLSGYDNKAKRPALECLELSPGQPYHGLSLQSKLYFGFTFVSPTPERLLHPTHVYNFGSGGGQAADKNALLTTIAAKYALRFIKWRFRSCAPVCVCVMGVGGWGIMYPVGGC